SLGNKGMPHRYADYLPTDGFTTLNTVSSIGASVLGASTMVLFSNVYKSYKFGRLVTVDDPWGFGNSLEWATSCPPPLRNFNRLPRIRSERPAFDLKYPQLAPGASPQAPPPGGAPLSGDEHHGGGAAYPEPEDVGNES